ncbi:hypothetical protein BH09PLA1_BH09PLA1_18370 [soil metagenome]
MSVETVDETSEFVLDPRVSNLSERTPGDIERQVMHTSAASSLDTLCAALDSAEWLLSRAKTIDRLMKEIAIQWIDQHGAFVIGDIEYSAGISTTVKCLNVQQTGHTLLEAVAGDVDRFFTTLVAQPFKHATARSFIDQKQYASLFKTTRTGRLVHGVPERVLKRADQRFVTPRTKAR